MSIVSPVVVERAKGFLRRYRWHVALLSVALLVGIIYFLPHLFRYHYLEREGLTYNPFSLVSYFDETNVTGARMHEILDGHFFVAEVDTVEHLREPSFLPLLTPLLLSPLLIVTHSLTWTMALSDFLFPFCYVFIFFGIGYLLFDRDKAFSLFFSIVISLFPHVGTLLIPSSFAGIKSLVGNFLPFQHGLSRDRLSLYLMESSIPDFLIFGGAFLCLLMALKTGKRRYFVGVGLLFGLMFYTYFFHWSYFFVVLSFLLAFFLIHKRWQELRKLLLSFGIGAIVSLYYFYTYFQLRLLPQYQQIVDRIWIEKSHSFRSSDWKYYLIAVVLSLLIYKISSKWQERGWFLISLLIAGIVVLNIQVIAGFNVQPSHWMFRTNSFALDFAVFFLMYSGYDYLRQHSRKWFVFGKVFIGIVIICLLSGSIHSQYVYARTFYLDMTIARQEMKPLDWISRNVATDAVILTPSLVTNYFIPVQTSGRIYLPRAINTLSSDDEMMERLFIVMRLFDIPKNYLQELLDHEANARYSKVSKEKLEYYDRRGLLYFFNARALPQDLDSYKRSITHRLDADMLNRIESNFDRYPEFSESLMSRYRIDYIFVGPRERALLHRNLDDLSFLRKVYDDDGVVIYKNILID